jgi:hypothetical protein
MSDYDYGLGIEPDIIDYIKTSHQIQIRVSPIRCYLLWQKMSGSAVGSAVTPIAISSYVETSPYKAQIWPGSYTHPDLRLDTNNGSGSISVLIDSIPATRVVNAADLINDTEFAIVKRIDLSSQRVEIVFNTDFNPTLHTVTYYYTDIDEDINVERLKPGEADYGALFNWTQYTNNIIDIYQNKNQVLVRMPLTNENVVINEEGLVTLKDNQCWTLAEPYFRNFDVFIVPADQSPTNQELRFQVQDKQDSIIQGTFVSQRFKVKLLNTTDPIYKISYSKV